jgi:asparagine synthase (glutamine-hydrolysing)
MGVQAGVWNRDGGPVNREVLTRISQAVAEYGPDGETTYCEAPVGMLYRPFHTTSESRTEHQPYISATRKVITWVGRLDNRHDLLPQLRDALKGDQSDVALVAAALDRWGTDTFARLIGDWAVTVWNAAEKELILARDFIGVRHLFYYPTRKRVIWSSHLAPLALCGDCFTLSEEYVGGYLAFEPDAHLTPYREILSVPPGKFVRLIEGGSAVHTFWALDARHRISHKTDGEYEEHLRHLFRQAVRRRLRADSPILAELSGGLDSSSIVCMADDILDKRGAAVPVVDTISFCDRGEPGEDDFRYYTKVEEQRGRTGHHVDISGLGDSLSFETSRFVATPDFGAREELKISRATIIERGNYRIILSGIGGDELLGQTLDPCVQMADLLVQRRLREFYNQLMAWSLLKRRPLIQLLTETLSVLLPTWLRVLITKQAQMPSWVNNSFARRHKLSNRLLSAAEGSWSWIPSARDSCQTHASLARQMTQTQPSVEEIRYPYLDQELVEFLFAIPTSQLLRPGKQRSLMRRAFAVFLPPEVLGRRTKANTGRCISLTLEKHWDGLEGLLSTSLISRLGYINEACFREALIGTKNGQLSHHTGRLVRALSLECWLRQAAAHGVVSVRPSLLGSVNSKMESATQMLNPMERPNPL